MKHGDKDTPVNISDSGKAKDAYLAAGADVRMEIIGGKNNSLFCFRQSGKGVLFFCQL